MENKVNKVIDYYGSERFFVRALVNQEPLTGIINVPAPTTYCAAVISRWLVLKNLCNCSINPLIEAIVMKGFQ